MKHLNNIGFVLAIIAIAFLLYAGGNVRNENESLRAKIRQYETRDSINALNVDTIVFVGRANSYISIGGDSIRIQAFTWARKPR